jgi:ankyrin repeat protein
MRRSRSRILFLVLVGVGIGAVGCRQTPEELQRTLFDAVKNDDLGAAQRVIKKGVNVNAVNDGWTPLHFAASVCSVEITKALLAAGADPNFVGTAAGQKGTVVSLKAKVVAQGRMFLAQAAQSNPLMLMQVSNPEEQKRLKDPRYLARCQELVPLLEKVTKD